MALEGEMVNAAPTAAERRMIMAKYIDLEALVEWLKRIPLKDLSDGRGLFAITRDTSVRGTESPRWTEVEINERRNAGSLRGNRERYVPH